MANYTDYPQAATNNAKRALKWREETNNKNGCGTPVGWARANQLANREPISEDTVKRMASFNRHRQNKDVPYEDGCGGLMWDAWGGSAGVDWAIRKSAAIDREKQKNAIQNSVSNMEEIILDGFIHSYFGVGLADISEQLNNTLGNEVNMIINSGGGSVTEGQAIAAYMREHKKKKKIKTTGVGLVASIATIPFLSGDNPTLAEGSYLMIHNPLVDETGGESKDLRKVADLLDKTADDLANFYVDVIERNGKLVDGDKDKTKKKVKKMMDNETWMNPKEALENGFIANIETNPEFYNLVNHTQVLNYSKTYKNVPAALINKHQNTINMEVQNQAEEVAKPTFFDKLKAWFAANPVEAEELQQGIEQIKAETKEATPVVEAVETVEKSALDAALEANEALKAEIEALKAEKETAVQNSTEEIEGLKSKLVELENKVSGASAGATLKAEKEEMPENLKRIAPTADRAEELNNFFTF